jgi:hypothetical protein
MRPIQIFRKRATSMRNVKEEKYEIPKEISRKVVGEEEMKS